MTKGVLLMAYGGPSSLDEVEPYYTDIRGGRPPTARALAELVERYRRIGGTSPLLDITRLQARALQYALNSTDPGRFATFVGMKHWHPYIKEAVAEIASAGIEKVIGLALAPHYSKMSVGGYEDRLIKARNDAGASFDITMIPSWYEDSAFIDFVATHLRSTLEGWDPSDGGTRVFFTAHSLPERILSAGDPYRDQLLHSSKLVADAAGIAGWEFAFQSASVTGEPWLGPDLLDRLDDFASTGGRRVLVAPIGFVSDHLEVLFDVDVECAGRARGLGLEFRRVPSANGHPKFIEALAGIVVRSS